MEQTLPVPRNDASPLMVPVSVTETPSLNWSGLDPMVIAQAAAQSGDYPTVKSQSQALLRMMRGAELGVGPTTALSEIQIIHGRTTLSPHLMATLIQRSGRFSYRITRLDSEACEISFFESGAPVGTATFTYAMAVDAELPAKNKNWQFYREDMLYARAMSRGARRFCPAVFGGPVYIPGEVPEPDFTPVPAAVPSQAPRRVASSRPALPELTVSAWSDAVGDDVPEDTPDRRKMVQGWPVLFDLAIRNGIEVEPLPVNIPTEALMAAGKTLRGRIPPEVLQNPPNQSGASNEEPEVLVCTADGCGTILTRGQYNLSRKNFGQALCPSCQRMAAPRLASEEGR